MNYYIRNIELHGNEHGKLRKDTIYAELCHADGPVVIIATLEYILATIRDRKLKTENVAVGRYHNRGAKCSSVKLTLYGYKK